MQKFQQDAQSSYQKKQTDLLDPIFKKIGKAIEEVAKENGFTLSLTLNCKWRRHFIVQ